MSTRRGGLLDFDEDDARNGLMEQFRNAMITVPLSSLPDHAIEIMAMMEVLRLLKHTFQSMKVPKVLMNKVLSKCISEQILFTVSPDSCKMP